MLGSPTRPYPRLYPHPQTHAVLSVCLLSRHVLPPQNPKIIPADSMGVQSLFSYELPAPWCGSLCLYYRDLMANWSKTVCTCPYHSHRNPVPSPTYLGARTQKGKGASSPIVLRRMETDELLKSYVRGHPPI